VLVQVLLKWLTLLLDIYYSNIITSGNISDGNVKLSGVWFLRVQELNCLDYRSDLDEADAWFSCEFRLYLSFLGLLSQPIFQK